MATHSLRIPDERMRGKARAWLDRLPIGSIVRFIVDPKHSDVQREKLWAMLGDISKQCLAHGKKKSPETWKLLILHSLKYDCAFEMGLNGEPFPTGFSIKPLTVPQMADLIEWTYKYGAENDVVWSENGYEQR